MFFNFQCKTFESNENFCIFLKFDSASVMFTKNIRFNLFYLMIDVEKSSEIISLRFTNYLLVIPSTISKIIAIMWKSSTICNDYAFSVYFS